MLSFSRLIVLTEWPTKYWVANLLVLSTSNDNGNALYHVYIPNESGEHR